MQNLCAHLRKKIQNFIKSFGSLQHFLFPILKGKVALSGKYIVLDGVPSYTRTLELCYGAMELLHHWTLV